MLKNEVLDADLIDARNNLKQYIPEEAMPYYLETNSKVLEINYHVLEYPKKIGSLNLEKTGINNLDLDLDGKVDFIKVETKQDGDDFTFVLQVAVSKTETQDVAVILVSKDKDKKVTMQIVGDKDLYGKDYIVEPKTSTTPAVTAAPVANNTPADAVVPNTAPISPARENTPNA